MAATTKLIVYNETLREIGGARLANLVDTNTRLTELDGAWDHAVEYVLSQKDWNFARRRATLTGVSDTSFSPYTYRYTKPSDYLRKAWIKSTASDDYQIDHAEIGSVFYGFLSSALIEYVSDTNDNYDPANWPPHFTRCVVLYLAELVAPRLARAGADLLGRFQEKLATALDEADGFEQVFLTNTQIAANRQPVMRRAIEFMGQALAGSVAIHSHTDMLRWHMNQAWGHAVKYVLEQGAWNFATRRVRLTGGSEAVPGDTDNDIIEGYTLAPATEPADSSSLPAISEWQYGHNLPSDFLHKIWVKSDANDIYECEYQFMRDAIYSNQENIVIEYVAWDTDSQDPGEWSANFTEAVAAYLAVLVVPELVTKVDSKGNVKIDHNKLRDGLNEMFLMKLSDAKLRDALQQKPVRMPPGRFVQARLGNWGTANLRRLN